MTTALLLLPDFLLIALGFVVCRFTALDRSVWDGAERLVYYLLFPVLLFSSIVQSPLSIASAAPFVLCGLGVTVSGIVLSYALRALPGIDRTLYASGAQVAFRFNSYVALALAERLGGAVGVASIALLVSVCVPLSNVAAVWPLAREGGLSTGRELLRNPLIVSTVAGLLANLAGVSFPDAVGTTLRRIGAAALPLGLMAVGAGLRFGALRESPKLAAALLGIRHGALPLVALALVLAFALPEAQRQLLVMFAAMPTASSAYVLAVRLGGHGGYVAGLVTVSTLIAMASLPLWLALAAGLAG